MYRIRGLNYLHEEMNSISNMLLFRSSMNITCTCFVGEIYMNKILFKPKVGLLQYAFIEKKNKIKHTHTHTHMKMKSVVKYSSDGKIKFLNQGRTNNIRGLKKETQLKCIKTVRSKPRAS